MFSHIFVGADDVAVSKKFYDAVFGAIGVPEGKIDPRGRVFYRTPSGTFGISEPIDGKAATYANGGTIGFACDSAEKVKAFHDAGVANGGKTIEDPPGWREGGATRLYLAYLRDPYGNKICALHRGQRGGGRSISRDIGYGTSGPCVMGHGQIVFEGTPDGLREAPEIRRDWLEVNRGYCDCDSLLKPRVVTETYDLRSRQAGLPLPSGIPYRRRTNALFLSVTNFENGDQGQPVLCA